MVGGDRCFLGPQRLARNHETDTENCHLCNEGLREEATLVNRASPMGPYVGRGF